MGFIKGVLGKIHHFIIDLGSNLLRNPLCHASRHLLLFISVNKVGALLFHNGLLLFAHGTPHQIAPSQGIASQVADDLHDLLLVHDTAIGRLQDRFQLGTAVGNRGSIVLSPDIFGNKVHWPRTVQRNSRNDVLQVLRPELLHEAFHSAAFKLEHAVRFSCSDGSQNLLIVHVNVI